MSKKKSRQTELSGKPWIPDGACGFKPHLLTTEQKTAILEIATAEKHQRKDEFIHAIELAIGGYLAWKEFQQATKPAKVKSKMNAMQKHVNVLMDDINSLDEFSWQLLIRAGRGPNWTQPGIREENGALRVGAMPDGTPILDECKGFTFLEAKEAVNQIRGFADTVLHELPRYATDQKHPDIARDNLAYAIHDGVRDIIGTVPTSDPNGVFSNVLREVVAMAGIKPKNGTTDEDRDVTDLVRKALGRSEINQ